MEMICGTSVSHCLDVRRLFARWVSMNVRWAPPIRQNGFSALTVPAPFVHRVPAPAASVSTATAPEASASIR